MELEQKIKIMEKRVMTTKAQLKKVINGLGFIEKGYKLEKEEEAILRKAYEVLMKMDNDLMFEYKGENELLTGGNIYEYKAEPHTNL